MDSRVAATVAESLYELQKGGNELPSYSNMAAATSTSKTSFENLSSTYRFGTKKDLSSIVAAVESSNAKSEPPLPQPPPPVATKTTTTIEESGDSRGTDSSSNEETEKEKIIITTTTTTEESTLKGKENKNESLSSNNFGDTIKTETAAAANISNDLSAIAQEST